ncbi:MAG: fimbrillin family protein [Muribaculaceae bacterium]|nr:fimbrillin family protein [Muribaculaceae bacterium]
MNISDFKINAKLAVVLILPTVAAACSDDTADSFIASDSLLISFSVATADAVHSSRAAADVFASDAIPLSSADADTLFLVASSEPSAAHSRATAVDASSMDDFGVYALLGASSQSELYMDNVAVSREGDGWAPRDEYLWPGDGSLRFLAYSPYAGAPSDEGVTALPDYTSSGNFVIGFTTPSAVADQFDLLRALPVEASVSPCALQFEHALAGVRFAVGSKMAPCHVDRIEITGVASKGSLDLMDGTWSDVSDVTSYAIEPDCTLAAAEGSDYVAPSTPISAEDMTMMFIPQTLGDDASVRLTITTATGGQSELTASLAGVIWTKGTTVTYHLSADPAVASLSIELLDVDGNRLDSIASPYTGAAFGYTVRSVCSDGSSAATPVAWKATFLDADGNPLASAPDWITSFVTEGSGIDDCTVSTQMTEPEFLAMSPHTEALRQAPDINASSGHTPYNLSSSDGSATVVNTANSYIINAPGSYSIPLVYGNAVKGGAPNSAAYISSITSTTTHKKKALLDFVNHLGKPISDPYIYNNAGCTPVSASLLWEDRLNLIRNVELSSDGHSILFEVPAASIRQGNAVVAVSDADGNVMWSWHIWVTDFVLGQGWVDFDEPTATETHVLSIPLGRLYAGDNTLFPRRASRVRFTQTDVPAGMEPASVEMIVAQESKTVYTGDCYTYFQWGRKDPMISGLDVYYNAAHQELNAVSIPTQAPGSRHEEMIVNTILHPQLFVAGDDASLSAIRSSGIFYQNLWSINQIDLGANGPYAANVKTVYDPSPFGAKVSVGNAFLTMRSLTGEYDAATMTMNYTLPSGTVYGVPMLGYRSGRSTTPSVGSGESWASYARNPTTGTYCSFATSGQVSPQHINILYGYALIPVADN